MVLQLLVEFRSFIDGDTESFRFERMGIYQAYRQMHQKYENSAPEVMSTGYIFYHKSMPMLELACRLDQKVREATDFYVPLGVYYPEPNFVIKILKEEDTVIESFLGRDGDYESPQEATIILKNVSKRNGTASHSRFSYYFSDAPLVSKAPLRATQNKSKKNELIFSGKKLTNGKFGDWNKQDIINITRNISQSHVASRDWTINLLHAFKCNNAVNIGEIPIKDGKVIRHMAISLLSRLFNVYDPIGLFENYSLQTHKTHEDRFYCFLESYDSFSINAEVKKSPDLKNQVLLSENKKERILPALKKKNRKRGKK